MLNGADYSRVYSALQAHAHSLYGLARSTLPKELFADDLTYRANIEILKAEFVGSVITLANAPPKFQSKLAKVHQSMKDNLSRLNPKRQDDEILRWGVSVVEQHLIANLIPY